MSMLSTCRFVNFQTELSEAGVQSLAYDASGRLHKVRSLISHRLRDLNTRRLFGKTLRLVRSQVEDMVEYRSTSAGALS